MSLSPQDGLIYLMVVTSAADNSMTDKELSRIGGMVDRMPIFEGYDTSKLNQVASQCLDLMAQVDDLEKVLDVVLETLPKKWQDTAYAVAVEVAAVDLSLQQEELRWLEMIRDRLDLDRLTTAAIEVGARARFRKA